MAAFFFFFISRIKDGCVIAFFFFPRGGVTIQWCNFKRQPGNRGNVLGEPQKTFLHVMLVIGPDVTDDSLRYVACFCEPERLARFSTHGTSAPSEMFWPWKSDALLRHVTTGLFMASLFYSACSTQIQVASVFQYGFTQRVSFYQSMPL